MDNRRGGRRRTRNASNSIASSSNSANVSDNIPQAVENTVWVLPDAYRQNWSTNVVQFYYNGDTEFCYSFYMGHVPLGREFWGGLLGFTGNGYIEPVHVHAWCNFLTSWRRHQITNGGLSEQYRWTILPFDFFELISDQDRAADNYANGNRIIYPPLWEVDTVYLPVSLDEQNWFLFQIDMEPLQIHVYFPSTCSLMTCGDLFCVHRRIHEIQLEFESSFIWFLGHISYWQKSGKNEISTISVTGDSVWPINGAHIGHNSGVLVCMLLRILVQNRSMAWEERNLHEACMRYRRYMADEIYAGRYVCTDI